jgi:hypothetical protein
MLSIRWQWFRVILVLLAGQGGAAAAGKHFGDIEVSTRRIVNGNTHHGYFEHRFTIANRNPSEDYVITISLPGDASSRGAESIHRLQRTTKVNAGGVVTIPVLQPALPVYGDNSATILINGRSAGKVYLSGGFDHAENRHTSTTPRTILVSRSLDSSALDGALRKSGGGLVPTGTDYSPERAQGPPDVPKGRGGYQPLAWLPAHSGRGHEWLEVDFSNAVIPQKIRLIKTGRDETVKRLDLFDAKGKTIVSLANTNTTTRYRSQFTELTLSAVTVTQKVHRVRVEMDTHRKGTFGIDSVELIGKSESVFASGARASSSYSTVVHGSGSRSAADHPTVMRAEWEASDWSDNWLAYTAFDMIVLHARDFRSMPAGVKEAVWRFVEAGGVIAVIGKAEVPAPWAPTADDESAGLKRYRVGFGECLEIPVVTTRELGSAQLREIQKSARATASVWGGFGNAAAANGVFPVIDNLSVPVRGVSLIMLLFILAVGPINIFILARMNRRIWMLWTVPLISFVTCGIVFAYSLFSEGITPTVRMEAITVLNHTSHRATTLGRLAYYCPLTPSGGLRFGYEAEIFPIVDRNWRSGGTSKSIDWTAGQHLESGWIQARMPSHFAVRKSETRRERVQFEKQADGRWAAINGIGSDIKKLDFKDPAGKTWQLQNLQAGGKAIMAKGGKVTKRGSDRLLREIFQKGLWTRDGKSSVAQTGLAAGTYLADLESSPFMEVGLAGEKHLRLGSVILGIVAPEEFSK